MSRTALLLVIGSCGIFLSACGGQESSPVPTNVASTLAENTPVIYDGYLSPKPLTPVQIGRILRMAESVSKGKVVWYIHVYRNNPVPDWEENWSVSVIFKPEQVSARVRRGVAIQVFVGRDDVPAEDGTVAKPRYVLMSSKPAEYVQVSAPGQTWGKGLSVPEQALCPFSNPKGVSEGDVVEIVDFIRELQARGPVLREGDMEAWVGEKDAPIVSIRAEEGKDIEVWTGPTQHKIGTTFQIVKKGSKWTLISTGSWVS